MLPAAINVSDWLTDLVVDGVTMGGGKKGRMEEGWIDGCKERGMDEHERLSNIIAKIDTALVDRISVRWSEAVGYTYGLMDVGKDGRM